MDTDLSATGGDMSTSRVLIVGAGPAGATAAAARRHGSTPSSSNDDRPVDPPGRHLLSTRTLEVFRELTSTRCAPARSRYLELRDSISATSLTGPGLGRPLPTLNPLKPDRFNPEPDSAADLSQHVLGQVLWDQLGACQRVEFHRGSVYRSRQDTSDRVEVRVTGLDGDDEWVATGRYLIGADGAGGHTAHMGAGCAAPCFDT